MNTIQIAGHLGSDPEVRFTPSGQKVTSFRLASNTRKGGKEETTWYRITIWGERFDKMMPYLKKGSAVIVVGELHKPEIFTNRDGNPQIGMEVTAEMLRFSPFGRPGQGGEQEGGASMGERVKPIESPAPAFTGGGTGNNNDEDELPF